MSQLSEVMEKITADYRRIQITSVELYTFLPVIKRLAQGPIHTFRIAKQLGYNTDKARAVMGRMQALGYVAKKGRSGTHILWELSPCTCTTSPSLTANPAE